MNNRSTGEIAAIIGTITAAVVVVSFAISFNVSILYGTFHPQSAYDQARNEFKGSCSASYKTPNVGATDPKDWTCK